ncbi:MAG: TonB-dependent receptor, partial [Bacteroidota bacterium]
MLALTYWVSFQAFGQGQALRGEVLDAANQQPLIGATIKVLGTSPLKGGSTDADGQYVIADIPVGRYEVEISYVGYSTRLESSVVIGTAQATQLSVALSEKRFELRGVTVQSIERPVLNESALLSARSFSVEEMGRIPFGLDDPARMAQRFAGVVPNTSLLSNELRIRGHSSRSVLWRIGGVDIYNPSHFAGLSGTGGAVTILSQRLLSNTDFYSGAFPADYGNTVGGVMDVQFRNGNMEERAHSAQLSVMGIDFATEGPLGKKGNNSYLANYRYSTTNFLRIILPLVAIPTYQDLSFKIHHRLDNGAHLDFFGMGGRSSTINTPILDTAVWVESPNRSFGSNNTSTTATTGITYLHPVSKDTYLSGSIIGTGIFADVKSYRIRPDLISADTLNRIDDFEGRLAFSGYVNHQFGPRHTHRTGIIINGMHTDVFFTRTRTNTVNDSAVTTVETLRTGKGNSALLQAYSRSQFYPNEQWQINAGLHLMYFAFTSEVSVEPRLSARWQFRPNQSLAFAYGLHSQLEPFFTYVNQQPIDGQLVAQNQDLRFNKAHHFNLGWRYQPTTNLRLGVELYYQHQYDLVVAVKYPIARMGFRSNQFEAWDLNNGGTARNMGVELAAERRFNAGYYFLTNVSLFDATYVANDGIRRNGQYNAQFVTNGVVGKEWAVGQARGKNNFLSANLTATYGGPQYYTWIDEDLWEEQREVKVDLA